MIRTKLSGIVSDFDAYTRSTSFTTAEKLAVVKELLADCPGSQAGLYINTAAAVRRMLCDFIAAAETGATDGAAPGGPPEAVEEKQTPAPKKRTRKAPKTA